jgi:hypothetical protein
VPKPLTGVPSASVTVKSTTGGLLILTSVTVTRSDRFAHVAAAASVAGVALLGTVMIGPGPGGPDGPCGPCGPCAPVDPVSPLQPATTRAVTKIDTVRRNELIMATSLAV